MVLQHYRWILKSKGISREILEQALEQARAGRLHILGIMNEVIKEHKEAVSDVAPQIHVMNINPAKIKDVVGRGGATVKGIVEKTGAQIDTSDSGEVKVLLKTKIYGYGCSNDRRNRCRSGRRASLQGQNS